MASDSKTQENVTPNCHSFAKKVKKKLGEDVRDSIINSVLNGTIDSDKMKDIAYKLHEHVGGRHVIRTISGCSQKGFPSESKRRTVGDMAGGPPWV